MLIEAKASAAPGVTPYYDTTFSMAARPSSYRFASQFRATVAGKSRPGEGACAGPLEGASAYHLRLACCMLNPLNGAYVRTGCALRPGAPAMSKNTDLISEGSRVGDVALIELASPRSFREGSGPDWKAYAGALKLLDAVWRDRRVRNTSFGVIGPQPSWEDTIARVALSSS
jgi:hypothetical protein